MIAHLPDGPRSALSVSKHDLENFIRPFHKLPLITFARRKVDEASLSLGKRRREERRGEKDEESYKEVEK